jgi:phosphatidylglycerol:prolipoprotein diacylglycerol transferase
MLPEIQVGPLTLYTFGLLSVLGFWVCGFVLQRFWQDIGRPGEWAWEMVLGSMVFGVFGASIDWALQNKESLQEALGGAFTGGGLVWFGGMIGALVFLFFWSLYRKNFGWEMFAVASVGFLIVQFFGRLGCQLAGDGDYGIPWDGPWAMSYADGIVPTPPGVLVHPTPLYEALGLAISFALLWRFRWRLGPQRMAALWLIAIFLIRFPVEFIRLNPDVFLGLTTAQLISLLSLLLGLAILVLAQWGKLGSLSFALQKEKE